MSGNVIIDYGMGNLRSVQKALEKVGAGGTISADPAVIERADRVILPGVGAFRDAIQALQDQHLVSSVQQSIRSGKPFLGICLGMQLLMDVSYEDGEFQGLGVVSGAVRRFELPPELKIPHMGWNQLSFRSGDNPLMKDIPPDAWFYFVHSYFVDPVDSSWTAGRTSYGTEFASMLHRNNVFATQFHPEKSQSAGLQLLKNFTELS
ncbi:MAG: imidazole glycerol phosphate synthase subunit HisH [Planctomycetaceae bacterium]